MKALLFVFVYIYSLNALNNGVALTPPMGWTTWCTETILPCFDDWCNETEIRSIADSMVASGLKALGYTYILLDDCWGGGRDPTTQEIYPDPTRFPSGMASLASYIHDRGLYLGLYTDIGNQTCRGGRPGSGGHYIQDANTFARWGADMVKMDFCDRPPGSTEVLYGMMRDALNQTGRHMVFDICEWGREEVWTWGSKTANTWRVGPDHLPLWWTPDTDQDPGQGQGTANVIQHMAGLSQYAGPGGWNDPDFLMTGEWWLSDTDSQTEFSFWCLFAAPLFVATDIRELSNKKEILNSEAIAVNQDKLGIAGDLRVNLTSGAQVWSKPLSNQEWAVILYNSNLIWWDVDVTVSWNNQQLPGWPATAIGANVRDLWAHQQVGNNLPTNFTVSGLGPHETR